MTTLIPKFDLKNGGSTPSGAVNRSIYLKLAEEVSIKDFGAVGDGTTDDTAAINAALAASSNVIVPIGMTCLISSTIAVTNETRLFLRPVTCGSIAHCDQHGGHVICAQIEFPGDTHGIKTDHRAAHQPHTLCGKHQRHGTH